MNIIDKLAWTPIKDRKILFARSRGKDVFYCAGGKREAGETDEQAVIREVEEELGVALVPETISHIHTFEGPAHGFGPDTLLKMACYSAEHTGTLTPSHEIEEFAWLTSTDTGRTSEMGQSILRWFHEQGLID